ncbi:MAG: hypothetical protein Tsb0020_38950 [Haliangiales bacterium]
MRCASAGVAGGSARTSQKARASARGIGCAFGNAARETGPEPTANTVSTALSCGQGLLLSGRKRCGAGGSASESWRVAVGIDAIEKNADCQITYRPEGGRASKWLSFCCTVGQLVAPIVRNLGVPLETAVNTDRQSVLPVTSGGGIDSR